MAVIKIKIWILLKSVSYMSLNKYRWCITVCTLYGYIIRPWIIEVFNKKTDIFKRKFTLKSHVNIDKNLDAIYIYIYFFCCVMFCPRPCRLNWNEPFLKLSFLSQNKGEIKWSSVKCLFVCRGQSNSLMDFNIPAHIV